MYCLADTVLLKQLIPSQLSGAVLGKGGVTVAKMTTDTNTSIKMSKAGDFYPGRKTCYVTICLWGVGNAEIS